MISFCKYRRALFLTWFSSRFILCQKNTQKRSIHWIFSSNRKLLQFHFQNRSYFCSPILRISGEKTLLIEKHAHNIATIFGVSAEKVKKCILLGKGNFVRNDDDVKILEEISEFLTSVNISLRNDEDLGDILAFVHRKTPAPVIEQRYLCFKEMGFTNITIPRLFSRYKTLLDCTVNELHAAGELASDVHPLDFFISTAGVPNLADIINTKYKTLRSGPIYSMHHAVMVEFLVSKLNSSHQEILQLFKKNPSIRIHSFHSIKQMLKLLIEDVGLSEEKITSNGFLLCLNSREVPCLLESLQELLIYINVTELIKKYPIILCVQVENIKKIGKLFQQYNITPQHIMKKGNILLLNPSTVSERLKFLEETPELKEMKSDLYYLDLVFSYNKALKRMEYLKKVNLPISLNFLCCSEGNFQIYISSHEDREMRKKVIGHLASVLNTSNSQISRKLNFCYISAKCISIDEINERINFLERNKVPKKDILNNLSALLLSEQDLLKKIDRKEVAKSHSEVKSKNHSDIAQQNASLQVLLNMMKSRLIFGKRIIEEQIDVNEILQKL